MKRAFLVSVIAFGSTRGCADGYVSFTSVPPNYTTNIPDGW
ncbi:MAG: hypothetical protein NTW03_15425 [Verrucomicrobia bacterium]|nr:hypothetical protein [Verrucomicrobiota bacterium]